ncbi:MAG: hypothetical protein NDI88_09895, partial [Lysobacter sp.]|nr:hypothetical protein [Lysobacter sp.]
MIGRKAAPRPREDASGKGGALRCHVGVTFAAHALAGHRVTSGKRMEKSRIVEALGEEGLRLPALLNE